MKIVKFISRWLAFFARKEFTVNRKNALAQRNYAKCFLIHFSPVVVTYSTHEIIALNCGTSSITKDDHFSVWSWNCTSNHTWNFSYKFLSTLSISPFSTMMLLLNRHLTRYKWYFCVILLTHGGMWFVCDKCNWLRGCFLLLQKL
jgi:hypothetical protein